MPFASGSSHGLRFIREAEFGVTPENPDMMALRHTSCSLVLTKDSFQSNELRRDAQISDLRHGVKQCSGDIGIELSYGEFDDFLAAAIRGEWTDNVLVAGINTPYFTIERVFEDIKQYQTFTGCAVNTLSLDIQPNAMITGTIGVIGKNGIFTDIPTASNELPALTNPVLDCFKGTLKEGGLPISVITSISLSIENSIEAANVVGSDVAAALVSGRINITGTVSAYFENLDLLNKFVNETESEIEVTFGTGGPGSYKITLPRIKYTGGTNSVDGEGPLTLDMPFQALLDDCTGTNIIIERIPPLAVEAEPCELSFSGTQFTEDADTEGVSTDTVQVTLSGGNGKEFNGADNVELPGVTFENVPEGLTAKIIRTSTRTAELSLAGSATNHDASSTGTFTANFTASAFKKGYCECAGDTVANSKQEFDVIFND